MRKAICIICAVGTIAGLPALAQTSPPGGGSPFSTSSSHINQSDTRSPIAPSLPQPPLGDDASVRALLIDARAALSKRRTGAAQEALEQAETRLLTRSVRPDTVGIPASGPLVTSISDARQALARRDIASSMAAIERALAGMPGR